MAMHISAVLHGFTSAVQLTLTSRRSHLVRVPVFLVRPMAMAVYDPSVGMLVGMSLADHEYGCCYDECEGDQ